MNTIKNISDKTNFSSPLGVGGRHFIDISAWKRREHFEVFRNFDEPLFGITVRVECSEAYKIAKERVSMKAANEIEEFRYRIENDKVVCYDSVGAGPTVFREDETYGCAYMPYNQDIETFMMQAKAETERVKAERGLKFPYAGEDIIHYSTLPWADFTSTCDGEKMWLPVDIHVNHALMDGFHVGKYVERYQELLKNP